MAISKEGIDITNRFFEAIDILIAQKKIRGLQTLTKKYNINRLNLMNVKNNPEKTMLKPELLVSLVENFNKLLAFLFLCKKAKVYTEN